MMKLKAEPFECFSFGDIHNTNEFLAECKRHTDFFTVAEDDSKVYIKGFESIHLRPFASSANYYIYIEYGKTSLDQIYMLGGSDNLCSIYKTATELIIATCGKDYCNIRTEGRTSNNARNISEKSKLYICNIYNYIDDSIVGKVYNTANGLFAEVGAELEKIIPYPASSGYAVFSGLVTTGPLTGENKYMVPAHCQIGYNDNFITTYQIDGINNFVTIIDNEAEKFLKKFDKVAIILEV